MDGSFQRAAEALDAAGVTFLLGGGFAVNAHGYARGTEDIDLLVSDVEQAASDHALGEAGFRCFRSADVVRRYQPPAGLRFVLDVLPLDAATFARLWADAVSRPFQGREVRIPSLAHLLAMKIHAMKHDQLVRGLKDLLDIVELARRNGLTSADSPLKDWCLKYGDAQVWESVRKALTP